VEVEKVPRPSLRRRLAGLAWLVIPVAVIGEAGHRLLEAIGRTLAHHLFHVLFAGGAAVVFLAYVAVDVRRYGWPDFSWRARPEEPTESS
jgi:hypothetical protein